MFLGGVTDNKHIYKIPLASFTANPFICFDTSYSEVVFNYFAMDYKTKLSMTQVETQKPVYYNRFKYVGKGFKLIFKKKKKLFNCIFGYSHIY